MANYELHEFDPVKIITGEISPASVESIKYYPYNKTAKGTTVIDQNQDLSNSRTLFSLQTTKSSQKKFNQVISIDFEDFVEPTNNAEAYLSAKIQTLETTKSKLLANNNQKDSRIDELQEEINNLKDIIASGTFMQEPEPNNVPDTLFANTMLYADRTGQPGAPGYPTIQDRLLSKNRKAVARIQQDGNFIITVGAFDENGTPLPDVPADIKTAFGWNNSNNSVSGVHLYAPGNDQGQLEVVRISPWVVAWGSGRQKLTNAARLVLDDNGILTLYDGETPKWSSFGK